MKYAPQLYARALGEVLEQSQGHGHDALIRNFVRVLRKNRDIRAAPAIYSELERINTKKYGGRDVVLTFARTMPDEFISKIRALFPKEDSMRVAYDSTLVAGVRISIDGERELDGSLARKLKNLFRS